MLSNLLESQGLDTAEGQEGAVPESEAIGQHGAESPLHTMMDLIEDYQNKENCDLFLYSGPIERKGYDDLCLRISENETPRSNAILLLSTFGGDPHAAFRIARALNHNYPQGKLRVLVPNWCKSAGTLICIGADELILCDSSELGPLDVQVQKPDEMIGRISGLDILRGMESLKGGILSSFRQFLVDINAGTGISTKSAADVSTKLAIGIYEPILAQVDPMRLGEMEAALQIAYEYGRRLNEKSDILQADALLQLVHGYPSHSFVIDRKEARVLFKQVRAPNEIEMHIVDFTERLIGKNTPHVRPNVYRLDAIIDTLREKLATVEAFNQGSHHEPVTTAPQTESNDTDSSRDSNAHDGPSTEPNAESIGDHTGPDEGEPTT